MKLQSALVLFMCASCCFAAKARFDNYKLFSLTLDNVEQLKALQQIEQHSDSYDFWSSPHMEREVDVMVSPHKFGDFEELMTRLSINYYVKNDNIQNSVDAQDPELNLIRNTEGRSKFDWTSFNTLDEINLWLDSQVAFYPNVLSNIIIGTSYQGRPLRAIRYSARAGNPAIFIEANIHAREWTSSATATFLINELITSIDPVTREMATTIDWYIIPVANPDGFAYSHESDRMWRKTRQSWGACVGTDPNRNFDFFWKSGLKADGASNNPCSYLYRGPKPFSEPETAAIRDFYGTIASRVSIFLSFHAYGQYLLMPYGHTTSPTTNQANLISVANHTVQAIRNTFGSDYVYGSIAVMLYTASGSSVDWVFGVHNTNLAYAFEFRDIRGGSTGFLLPPAEIIPNCQEVINGIKAMVAQARSLGQL